MQLKTITLYSGDPLATRIKATSEALYNGQEFGSQMDNLCTKQPLILKGYPYNYNMPKLMLFPKGWPLWGSTVYR